MSRPDKYNDIMLVCVIIGLYLRKVNPVSFFFGFNFVSTTQRACVVLITVSFLPSPPETHRREEKKKKQKDKEGMRWNPMENLVLLLSSVLKLREHCSDSKSLVIFISPSFTYPSS